MLARGLLIFGFAILQRDKFPSPGVPRLLNGFPINIVVQSRNLAVLFTCVSQISIPPSHCLHSSTYLLSSPLLQLFSLLVTASSLALSPIHLPHCWEGKLSLMSNQSVLTGAQMLKMELDATFTVHFLQHVKFVTAEVWKSSGARGFKRQMWKQGQ